MTIKKIKWSKEILALVLLIILIYIFLSYNNNQILGNLLFMGREAELYNTFTDSREKCPDPQDMDQDFFGTGSTPQEAKEDCFSKGEFGMDDENGKCKEHCETVDGCKPKREKAKCKRLSTSFHQGNDGEYFIVKCKCNKKCTCKYTPKPKIS